MQCPRCRAENRAGRRFCGECGQSFALTCPACGFLNEGDEKFCGGCGTAVTQASTTEPASPSPQSYTPKHLAERILTSKAAVEGERKQVTVLFADLKGSMELLVDRDPEEAREILDNVLKLLMDAVHRYEGTVNQVMGDGIMALFGAPVAHEDHAVRACYSALQMQESVKRYAEQPRRPHGVTLQIRVGLNSGEVVVRAIGSDLRMDYSAVGQTTHLAARMEQIADVGAIFITAATYALAESYVRVHERGPTKVKGLVDLVEVYELTGVSGLRTRFQASLSRGLSNFVGREAAIAQLRSALGRAASGHGQVVAMVGEPGVGKSRLLYEFVHGTDTRDWLILESRAFSYTQSTPYLPLCDLLKAYFLIQDRDDAPTISDKISERLVFEGAGRALMPPIRALLDVPLNDATWAALHPSERRQRTLDACRHLLVRESHAQPVLIIMEDLHWVDSETQAFLDVLVQSLAGTRILLLLNYRPEYHHNWGSKSYYQQIALGALPSAEANALLTGLLGSDSRLLPLKTLLIEETEGNPLFLEECVRSLIESNVLAGERGEYRLAADINRLRVPGTVHAILAARIDRLPPEDKALLQAAAVVGKEIPWTVLSAIAAADEADTRAALARLQSAEFIVEGQLFPDLQFTFRHALTHEVAYSGLLRERRRTLHAEVVDEIERLHEHRLTEHVETLGYHAVRGERWDKAVVYLRAAAEKARARSAHLQAVAHIERAIRALEQLPNSPARAIEAIELRLELRQSYYVLGDMEQVRGNLYEAERLAEAAEAVEQLAWVVLFIGEDFRLTGDLKRACEYYQRARALASADDVSLRLGATHYLGIAFHGAGRYVESVDLFRQVESEPRAFGGRWLTSGSPEAARIVNISWLVRSLAVLGQFNEAIVEAERAVSSAERLGSAYSVVLATLALGEIYRERGDWAKAISLFERCTASAEDGGFGLLIAQIASRLGAAYAQVGRIQEGVSLLSTALARLGSERTNPRYSSISRLLGEALLLNRELQQSRHYATASLEAARALHQRGDEAAALWLHGLATTDPTEARDSLEKALALASQLGMRPLVAHCHMGLGKLDRDVGDDDQGQANLTTAMTMYREMGMTYWLGQAEAQSLQ